MSYLLCKLLGQGALPNCQMLKFEVQKSGAVPSKSDLLNKISLEAKMSDFFSKFKLWYLVAFLSFDLQEHTLAHLKDLSFLWHNILKKCVWAVLRWFMWAQSNPLLLHKMAFWRFWLHLTVCNSNDYEDVPLAYWYLYQVLKN